MRDQLGGLLGDPYAPGYGGSFRQQYSDRNPRPAAWDEDAELAKAKAENDAQTGILGWTTDNLRGLGVPEGTLSNLNSAATFAPFTSDALDIEAAGKDIGKAYDNPTWRNVGGAGLAAALAAVGLIPGVGEGLGAVAGALKRTPFGGATPPGGLLSGIGGNATPASPRMVAPVTPLKLTDEVAPDTPPPVIPQPYTPSTSHLRHRPSAYSPDVPGEELTAKNIDRLDYTNGMQDVARASGIPYRNRSRFDVIADLKQKYPHLDKSKTPYDYKGFADTRGKGEAFHGTSSPIPGGKPSEGHYKSLNYYGNGFYTTDAADVAGGYSRARGAKDPTIYRVTENTPSRMYDMETPLTPELQAKLSEVGDIEGLIEEALSSNAKNMREVFDEIRDNSFGFGVPADEVQNIFDSIQDMLKGEGFTGMKHKGGLRTKAPEHDTRIYFNPETDVTLTKVDPATLQAPLKLTDEVAPLVAPADSTVGAAAATDGLAASQIGRKEPKSGLLAPDL